MSERRAIATLAIGDEFVERWTGLCEPNWRAYAERHGYEVICVTEPLDDSRRARDRSPAWQKLLMLSQPFADDLDRLVWVDSDVVFGDDAPDIAAGVPPEKVGAADELITPSRSITELIHHVPMRDYYGDAGLPGWFDHVVQSGVMVTSPRHHREIFEHVYDAHEDIPGMFWEMRPLSYELLERDVVHWLDPRFNLLWTVWQAWRYPELLPHTHHPRAKAAVADALSEAYCLHFAGCADEMEWAVKPWSAPPRPREVPRGRSPVLLFLHARPDTSAEVLEAVRAARPRQLLVVANAARPGVEGEEELVERTRALVDRVDWDCDVQTNFADRHTSQTDRIVSGYEWAFERVDRAVILEDDCVPDPSFFRWCDEMLDRYADEPKLMSISGTNVQWNGVERPGSYYYSRYPMIWGWATWRRAWERHDPEMSAWPELRDSGWLNDQLSDPNAVAFWSYTFERTYRTRSGWDYAWILSSWLNGALTAVPNVNLISNIGFRDDATNTQPNAGQEFAALPLERMEFPLRHPPVLAPDDVADAHTNRFMFGGMVSEMFGRVRHQRAMKASLGA